MHYSPLEIESIHYRIKTLEDYFPEYKAELNAIIQYAKNNDSSAALLKTRHILEKSLKKIWTVTKDTPAPSIFEITKDNVVRNILPNNIINKIHSIRTTCNIGVHGDEIPLEDVYFVQNLLFDYLNIYRIKFQNLSPIPITFEPSHSFLKYIKDSINSLFFISILFLNIAFVYVFINFNTLFMIDQHIYEGIFNAKLFVAGYSGFIVTLSTLFSWNIFKRFRNQSFTSRVISFELTFFFIFSFQYLFLSILDLYTKWF